VTEHRAATPLEESGVPDEPTQIGPRGIRFDFNDGCRVTVPDAGCEWRVRLRDLDTGNVLYDGSLRAGMVRSSKRYFVRFGIEVWADGVEALKHEYDAGGQAVLIQFPAGTLGDTIGWFPYAERFGQRRRCRLTVAVRERFIPLFAPMYPEIAFVTAAEIVPADFYATYRVMLYFGDVAHNHQPYDYELIGLHEAAAHLLGVDPKEERPRLAPVPQALGGGKRPIEQPYVCIATQSTAQCKYWNNPAGWSEVIATLKAAGYRVVCIDQKPVHGLDMTWNHIPNGAEDETGERPLMERINWLRHCEFFIGLSSGLSWLAWAAGAKVVLISGFTHPLTEFETPYRVINLHACNSCWNDARLAFDHKDYFFCPRHKGTPRQFECTRLITATQVMGAIRRIPGFGKVSSVVPDAANAA
jgi:autotransporter strand-loop-strand O-heptosyltransferase